MKNKLNSLIKRSSKLFGQVPLTFNDLFNICCSRKINSVLKDPSHPLFPSIKRSNRSGRIQYILSHTERYRLSFMPFSLKLVCESRTDLYF